MTTSRRPPWAGRRPRVLPVAALCVSALVLAACSGRELPMVGSGTSGASLAPSPGSSASALSSATASPSPSGAAEPGATELTEDEVIGTGLKVPWGVAFLPDGSALVGQRSGAVVRLGTTETPTKVGTVPGVSAKGEGGLLGLAIDQNAGDSADVDDPTATVYAYLTSTAGGNRVVRMSFSGGKLGRPSVVLKGIASNTTHNGGALIIGPDGNLWVGTGDAGVASRAQDRSSLNGKILRITKTGKVPKGNPFKGSPVWSYGHRNVQGLAFDSRNRLWATEFGQNTWDELNRIVYGRNYGWPVVEGKKGRAGFVDPAAQWKTSEASPSGLAIVNDVAYIGALKGKRIWEVPLSEKTAGKPIALLTGEYGRIRSVVVSPNQTLWITTSNRDGRGSPTKDDDRVISLKIA